MVDSPKQDRAPTDDYERQYMGGDEALHREKRVSRRTFWFMLAIAAPLFLLALASLGAFVFGGDPQGLGGAAILGVLSMFLGVLAFALPVARTIVTRSDLRFMVGLRLMRVPFDAITDTSIGTLDPATLRVETAKDSAQLASIFEARGRYVRVAWIDAEKKPRVVWIGSDDAEALRAVIDRARASSSGSSGVRVAAASDESIANATDDAAEAAAIESGGRRAGDG